MINQDAALKLELKSNIDEPIEENKDTHKVDTTALNGLRGILAMYIVVYHSLFFSEATMNILGRVLMTFFFLISGFVTALNDGKRQYAPTKCCTELCTNSQDEAHFDAKHFWRRRFARTMPLFYLTNIMCIPLVYAGHISHIGVWGVTATYVMNLFAVATWFGIPALLNSPSWFISTMWFFYWIVPSLLPKLQRYSIDKKQKWIAVLSLIQFIGGEVLIIFVMLYTPWGGWEAFWVGLSWPPSRLPMFIMGIFAGLLRNEGHPIWANQQMWTLQNWRKCSDRLALLFLSLLFIFGVFENIEATLDIVFQGIPRIFWSSAVWMQNGIAWFALLFIVSLTFDEGTSRISKMLTSRVALECGRISYAVYLVHEPIRLYLCWIIYGALTEPTCNQNADGEECGDQWTEYRESKRIPLWCVPVVWIVSIAAAVALNRLVEEPMRTLLRPPQKKQSKEQIVALAETEVCS